MKKVTTNKLGMTLAFILTLGLMQVLLVACNTATEPSEAITVNGDVAESAISAVGEETGGLVDQIGDLTVFASPSLPAKTSAGEDITKVYDDATQTWTITVDRERGDSAGLYYARVQRTYRLQFRNQLGEPQQYWLNNGDTAYSMTFTIMSGEGRHMTPRLGQSLTGLEGEWEITDVNTDTLTINGYYHRAACDTLKTWRARRTLQHTLQLNLSDVRGPRGSRLELSQKVSGTIEGTYAAQISFQNGNAYRERNVNREINIELGNGQVNVTVESDNFGGNLATGECQD